MSLGLVEFARGVAPSGTALCTGAASGAASGVAALVTSPWSGDHASNDPNVVTGIFFANRKVRTADGAPFSVLDIAPTVLGLVGVPVPSDFDRPTLVLE